MPQKLSIGFQDYSEKGKKSDNKRTWSHNIDSPILAKRDLKYNILKRFLDRQKKNLKRIKGKLIG